MQDATDDSDDDDQDAPPPVGDPFARQRERAAEAGGFVLDLPHHVLTWLPGRGERLIVSFDNLASLRETQDRQAWGQKFLCERGFGVLGVQVKRKDWFRDATLIDTLAGLRDDGFFRRVPAVSMYGASMGGFAALAFAPLAPGCTVLAFAPQRSLSRDLCPFETRYRHARSQTDWTLPFSDAAEGARAAGRAYLAYDPHLTEDRLHVAALAGPNAVRLPMPYLGHKLPPALLKMGLLKDLSLSALEGQLDPAGFARMMRARRRSVPWLTDLLQRARTRGHLAAGLRLADRLIAETPHWRLRQARRDLAAALRARR